MARGKKKTILVTGSAGFIGTNLTKKLLALGHRVVGVDNFYSSSRENISLFKKESGYCFLKRDVRKPLRFRGKINQIYHLACPASPPIYQKDPLYTLETAINGTRNILDLARKHKARMFHASTSEIYGDPINHPQKEDYWGNVNPVGVRSCYDEGKRVAETFCFEYSRAGIDVRLARIFNTYGPYMNPDDGRVVSNFITQALKGRALTIYGDGKQTRSFCYIDDLVRGMIGYMGLRKKCFGPVNLGNPRENMILELARAVLRLIPESKSQVVHKNLPEDDPARRKPNIATARRLFRWEPKVMLEKGLKKTIRYFRKSLTC